MIRVAGRIARWGAASVSKPLRAHLVPRITLLMLLVVQLDVIVDWSKLSEALRAQPAWVAAAAGAAAIGLNGWSERRAVADLLLGPRHALLRRQPAPQLAYGPAAAALLASLGLPLAVLATAWYGQPWAALLWVSLAAPAAALFGGGRPLAGALATTATAPVLALGQTVPALLPVLAVAVSLCTLPLLGWLTTTLPREGQAPPASVGVGSRWPWVALLHRDALALWRRDRGIVWGSLVAAPLVGTVLYFTRVNNRASELTLARTTLVALAAVGPLALAGVSAAARRLRGAFDPPRWPTAPWMRALAMVVLGALLLAPSWAAAAVGGAPDLGAVGHLRVAVLIGAVGAGAAWLTALRPRRTDHALFPWWIALCLGPALARPAWGPLLSIVLGVGAFAGATRALTRRRQRT
ncbi:MAG: hypothetical protein KTR31_17975 [Myxococcales bacterium]|nr:hypothetical protein [Myxococcales bacterium]